MNSAVSARALAGLLPRLDERAPVDAAAAGPRYRALSEAIAALLLDGRLAPGTRLPSERQLAVMLGVSRTTTASAYEDLAAQGLLERRQGAGSFLSLPAASQVSGPGSRMSRDKRSADTVDLSIASLPALPGVIERATLDAANLVGAFARADGYHPYGLEPLRELIAQHYSARGAPTDPDQVLITNGAQHGFVLVLRALTQPGDRVLCELPSYPGALEAIKAHSCRPVGVPLDFAEAGWDVAGMASALARSAPRLAYLMPDFHNPTGFLVGTQQRVALGRAARRSSTRVVVDESFVDIDLRPRPHGPMPSPMAALEPSAISLGSLSKPVWGGLRVGWVRADADTVRALAIERARSDMAGPVLDQLVALRVLADMDAVIAGRRAELTAQRDVLLAELRDQLPSWHVTPPSGGLFAWVQLNRPSATAFSHLLEARGVLLSPGSRFAADGTLERFVRIPFALRPEQLVRAVTTLAEAWHDLHDPHRSRRGEARRDELIPL